MEKVSSTKSVPGAKTIGDHWLRDASSCSPSLSLGRVLPLPITLCVQIPLLITMSDVLDQGLPS